MHFHHYSTLASRRKELIELIKRTFTQWQEDKASRLAAALAFYAILSIPPLLVLIITLVGQFADQATVQQSLISQARQLMGSDGADAIEMILEAATQPTSLSLAAITSVLILFFSASGVFVQLQDAMNTIWDVMPDPEKGIMNTIQKRVVSFLMVLAIGLLFLVLLVLSSVVAFLGNTIMAALPISLPLIRILNLVLAVIVLTGVFALIYRTLPDVVITWHDVTIGAAVTTVLFLLGVAGIGLYLQYSDPTSSYGAAGSLIVLLIFIYYSAQIFFLGAEFTQVYANMYGSHIRPEEGAVQVQRITEPQEGSEGNTSLSGETG
jgi:membrane protein